MMTRPCAIISNELELTPNRRLMAIRALKAGCRRRSRICACGGAAWPCPGDGAVNCTRISGIPCGAGGAPEALPANAAIASACTNGRATRSRRIRARIVPQASAGIENDRNLTDGARRCARKIMELAYRSNRDGRTLDVTVTYLAKTLGKSRRIGAALSAPARAGRLCAVEVVASERVADVLRAGGRAAGPALSAPSPAKMAGKPAKSGCDRKVTELHILWTFNISYREKWTADSCRAMGYTMHGRGV